MIPYLLHSSILLSGCFIFYWLFIRKETLFKLNRWVLITSILLCLTLPLISIPEDWSIQYAPVTEVMEPTPGTEILPPIDIAPSSDVISTTTAEEVIAAENISPPPSEGTILREAIPYGLYAWYIYLIGVAVFFLAFLVQLIVLLTKMYTFVSFKDGPYRIVELVKDEAPYSFFNSIFINPTKYDLDTYTQIIEHEKIHIQQAHFFDKMLAEFLLIAFWFNPFVWLLRNAITNNLEYLTDSSMLQNGTEKQTYQLSLLKVSVPQHPLNLTTNYNNSFLKNRIKMMNAKKSSASSSWKYLFLLPLIGFSMICLNDVQSKDTSLLSTMEYIDYQDQNPSENEKALEKEVEQQHVQTIKKTTQKEDLVNREKTKVDSKEKQKQKQKEAAKSSFKNKEKRKLKEKEASNSFMEGRHTNIKPGHWESEIDGTQVCFELNNSTPDRRSVSYITTCFKKSELSEIPRGADKDFFIKREAGTLKLNGSFSGNSGKGSFKFEKDKAFLAYLNKEGLRAKEKNDSYHLFLGNINKEYVNYLKSKNLKVNGKDLVKLGIFQLGKDELDEMIVLFNDLDEYYDVEDLIHFKIHGIDADYVNELKSLGFWRLNQDNIAQAKIHNVSPEYIKSLQEAGYTDMSMQDLIQFAIHDIDPRFIKSFEEVGITDLSKQEILQAGIHNLDIDFIKELEEEGLSNMDMDELIQFAIHNVDARDIKAFKSAGFELDKHDFLQAGIHNVSTKYIDQMRALGFKDADLNDFVKAKIHGVNPSFIKKARNKGYNPETLREYVKLKIGGI